jgi:hypothetical protein
VTKPKTKPAKATKPNLDEPVLVRLTTAQKRLFEAEATKLGLTLSAWIRMVLIQHLQPKSTPPPLG